jgi:hypothetical protein
MEQRIVPVFALSPLLDELSFSFAGRVGRIEVDPHVALDILYDRALRCGRRGWTR